MSARTLILGGGFGGIATAVELRRLLGDGHEIVLVDRKPQFAMGLRKNWGIAGIEPRRMGERRLDILAGRGIDVRRDRDQPTVEVAGDREDGPARRSRQTGDAR